MMSLSPIFASCLSAIIAQLSLADHSSNSLNSCGSYAHGDVAELGRYYYRCSDGMLDPQGCMDGSRSRIPIGETFRLNNYQMRCKLGDDGFMSTEYDACIIKGAIVSPGGTFENDKHWFTCVREGGFVVEELSGCMYNGRRVARHERVIEGDIVYECHDTESLPEMAGIGCTDNGKQYGLGETFTDDQFLYACSSNFGKPTKETFGCVKGDKKLYGWQTYVLGDVVYRCEVKKSKKAKHAIVGCLSRDNNGREEQKALGCHYNIGEAPWRYTVVCEQSGPSSVSQTRVNCIYGGQPTDEEPSGFMIEPGCFRMIDNRGVGCKNGTSGNAEFVTFEPTRFDIAYQNGLQLC